MSDEPRIHVPDRCLDDAADPVRKQPRPKRKRRAVRGTFLLRLDVEAFSEEHAWGLANACETLLRERAPAGVQVRPLELRHSRKATMRPSKTGPSPSQRAEKYHREAGQ